MKVRELIEQLGFQDPDAEVHFEYNYGDYWRTHVAPKVRNVDEGYVQYSEYHSMDKVIDPYDEELGDDDPVPPSVVILS